MMPLRVLLSVLLVMGSLGVALAQGTPKVAVLWIDPLKSIGEISTRSGIVGVLERCKAAGIGAVAIGVKTNTGEVLYESKLAPELQQWENRPVRLDVDPVSVFVEEGERRGIQIYAVFSVFSEGHLVERQGPVYETRNYWQSTVYAVGNEGPRLMPVTEWMEGNFAFVNPHLPEVQQYEISLVKEFVERYSVDGLLLDKVQFLGIESDFSDQTRALFMGFLGEDATIQWWPKDVLEWQFTDNGWQVVWGPLFRRWVQFRAVTIHDFLARLVQEIRRLDPTLPVGIFAGAWYPTYYEYGLNWASENNIVEEAWAPREYYQTAVAELVNYVAVGCYFPRLTTEEAEAVGAQWWMSVEGSSLLAMEVVNKVCPVYGSILVPLFGEDRARFQQAMETALAQTNGLYLYDLSAIQRFDYWDEVAGVLVAPSADKRGQER